MDHHAPDQPPEPTPRQALAMTRVLWGGLILAEVLFALVVVTLVSIEVVPRHPQWYPTLLYVAAIALALLTPLGYFARNQMYKEHWQGEVVTPRGYLMGNLVLLVFLQAAGVVGLLAVLMIGWLWPTLLIAALALIVQLANWPHGRPMQPRAPS